MTNLKIPVKIDGEGYGFTCLDLPVQFLSITLYDSDMGALTVFHQPDIHNLRS